MFNEQKVVEITYGDWVNFSKNLEEFSKGLTAEEKALLKTFIANAGAELDALQELENPDDDIKAFEMKLQPGVNIQNTKALVNNFKSSFSNLMPDTFNPTDIDASSSEDSSIIWIE